MKKEKIGTMIDEEIMRLARRRAVEQGKSISEVIQDALAAYLAVGSEDRREREAALSKFCGRPLQAEPAWLREEVEEVRGI